MLRKAKILGNFMLGLGFGVGGGGVVDNKITCSCYNIVYIGKQLLFGEAQSLYLQNFWATLEKEATRSPETSVSVVTLSTALYVSSLTINENYIHEEVAGRNIE